MEKFISILLDLIFGFFSLCVITIVILMEFAYTIPFCIKDIIYYIRKRKG